MHPFYIPAGGISRSTKKYGTSTERKSIHVSSVGSVPEYWTSQLNKVEIGRDGIPRPPDQTPPGRRGLPPA